jgi:Na+/H+-translocating membrane pyrophosphatase
MNKSKFWGFDVSHIVMSFIILAGTNVILNIINLPLILSWIFGIITLVSLRIISSGQKEGHLELLMQYITSPRIFLGHKERNGKNETIPY